MSDIRETELLEKLGIRNITRLRTEEIEESLNNISKRARGLEGLRKKPTRYGLPMGYHERIEDLHRGMSILYEELGKRYQRARKTNKALEDYENSLEYAWRPGDKERLQKLIDEMQQSKSKRGLFSILSIVFLLSSLFFISFSLTGNAIANLSSDNLALTGTGLFILGLVFSFFYIQEKKR